ncbi:DegV family protein [Peptostreptococcus faecalis]|uniref:DegV family protein n=1 Tax=Peptostreptococcus faecalis TaxID=2045015 RepID=UPI000C7B9514|nr:DegV family protein [Peptostreptococcus faecalis]
MNDIKIVCDSLSDITQEYIDKYDIEFMPINISINGRQYKDRIDLSGEEFYRIIKHEKIVPKTSQVSYSDFYNVFEKYTKEGKSILYISAAVSATGTYQSANLAKNDIEGGNIALVDSNSLCFGISLLVIRACELREQGLSLEEIVEELERIKEKVFVAFSCDDLEYLRKGGRISSTQAVLGTVLGIKPICLIRGGLVENVANARGKKNVAGKLIEVARKNNVQDLSDQIVYIGYSDNIKEKEVLAKKIEEEFNPKEIKYFMIGSGIGTHGGPGTTGFICYKE